jgi:drug/metabolite transporter (DMT)-like permease
LNDIKQYTVRGVLCTTIGGVFWGFSGTCGQYLFMNFHISSLWVTCMRLLPAGILLMLAAIPGHFAEMKAVWKQPRSLAMLACYGVFGLALCQFAYMTAISYSNAGTTTVLQNLSMVLIMLISCVRSRRAPNRREGAALILALAGTYLLATGGDPRHMVLSGRGLFWGLLTAVAVSLYSILPRRLLIRWGRAVVTAYGMLFGGIFLNLAGRSWENPVSLPLRGWLALAAIVVLGSAVAFSLFMQGVADIGPVKAAMLAATEPVSATVFSAVWLGTRFSAVGLLGFACIIATVFLLAKDQ